MIRTEQRGGYNGKISFSSKIVMHFLINPIELSFALLFLYARVYGPSREEGEAWKWSKSYFFVNFLSCSILSPMAGSSIYQKKDIAMIRQMIDDLSSKIDIVLMNIFKLCRILMPHEKKITKPQGMPSLPLKTLEDFDVFEKCLEQGVNLTSATVSNSMNTLMWFIVSLWQLDHVYFILLTDNFPNNTNNCYISVICLLVV